MKPKRRRDRRSPKCHTTAMLSTLRQVRGVGVANQRATLRVTR
ncbi:MAG: hypothetical protein WD042_12595 [Phycisphaeraceae bacterium]